MSSEPAHNVQVRVLVVEDHVALANRITEGLRDAGFAVDVVYDGAAAVDAATSTDYDVVVLDRDLPAVHGDRVCRMLVRNGSASRILMLTRKEFGVLECLAAADGAAVSAEELLEHVWDAHADPFSNTVAVTVGRLRRKLGDPPLIETVVGVGYRL